MKTDYLIIGSGIAGLTYALKVANHDKNASVVIITKASADESNTKYAQGGIAVVWDSSVDSVEQHIIDTMKAGDGLCNQKVVEMVVSQGPNLLKELIQWGATFDTSLTNDLDLGLEGGHSHKRIIHHKDLTGLEVERTLLKRINEMAKIKMLQNHFAVDLITDVDDKDAETQYKRCYGAYVFDKGAKSIIPYEAKIILLATGGIGEVYLNTTNPSIATGDGIAMAHRAKAKISNMEFVQFHPTALFTQDQRPAFLISEAVRGFGAILRNDSGVAFMNSYDKRGELASRDIVSRAIFYELSKQEKPYVFLDCRHLTLDAFKKCFPTIWERCTVLGIDLKKDMIPVVPVAHYICGGIVVNQWGQTSMVNLFAIGECSYTGLHGANRLASNSLLEALVFANQSFKKSIQTIDKKIRRIQGKAQVPIYSRDRMKIQDIESKRYYIQKLMNKSASIIRDSDSLKEAHYLLVKMQNEFNQQTLKPNHTIEAFELRNMIEVSILIIMQSLGRKFNAGCFYNPELNVD